MVKKINTSTVIANTGDNATNNMKHFIDSLIDETGMINKVSVKIPRNCSSDLFNVLNRHTIDDLDFQISTVGEEILIILKK